MLHFGVSDTGTVRAAVTMLPEISSEGKLV